MFKKLIMVFLIVGVLGGLIIRAEDDAGVLFKTEFNSRYIFHGIDFLPENKPIMNYGLEVGIKSFSISPYIIKGEKYLEWGFSLDFCLDWENCSFNTTIFPFTWQFSGHDPEWGIVLGEQLSFNYSFNPTLGLFGSYIPKNPEWNIFLCRSRKGNFGN
jgi:hypothetical protein